MVEWHCFSDNPDWRIYRAPIAQVPGTRLWLVAEAYSHDGKHWTCTGWIDEGSSEVKEIQGTVEGAKAAAELLALKVMEGFVWQIDRICNRLTKHLDGENSTGETGESE